MPQCAVFDDLMEDAMPDEPTGQEPTQDPEGSQGNPTPPAESETDRLKRENAQYRDQLRQETAKRLGAVHGLSATTVELLSSVPRDQQEAKAQALAAELGKTPAAPAPTPSTEPVSEPAGAKGLAAMQDGGAPEPVTQPKPANAALIESISTAKSWDELEAIQRTEQVKYQNRLKELAEETAG